MPTADHDEVPVVRSFRRRYRLALIVIGLMFTGALATTVSALRIDDGVAARVNVSGRQRMLSQRIALTARAAARDQDVTRNLLLLDSAITLMAESHARLSDPTRDPDLSAPMSPEIREMFDEGARMDARVEEYIDSARIVLALVGESPDTQRLVNALGFLSVQAAGPLLAGLDSMVNQYQGEGDAVIGRVVGLQYTLWAIAMAALLTVGFTLLRPVARDLGQALVVAREREATVRATQHLHQVGFLAANVAHDLKNHAGVAQGNLTLLGEDLDGMKVDRAPVDAALESVDQIRRTARRLLALSGPGQSEAVEMDLGALVTASIGMLRHAAHPVDLAFEGPTTPLPVRIVGRDLESALLNLISNARDALEGRAEPRVMLRVGKSPEGRAQLQVSDNGPGIPSAIRSRIFEPFVTAKPAGQGTGLGLAQVNDFATVSGGSVQVDDVPGGGTRFTIELPLL